LHYEISISPSVEREVLAVLQGPGLMPDGKPFIFASPARARAFAEAVNFAYEQGKRDALRSTALQVSRKFLVCGRTPETLVLRPERWTDRVVRAWRTLRSSRTA
jgi:hypothetical protein